MRPGVKQALDERRKQPVIPRLKNDACYCLYRGISFLAKAIEQEANDNTTDAAKTFTYFLECMEDAAKLFPHGISFPIEDRLCLLSLRTLGTTNYEYALDPSLETSIRSVRGDSMHIAGTIAEYIENDYFKVTARQHP